MSGRGTGGEGTVKEVRGSLKAGEQPVQRHRGVERQLGVWESRGVRRAPRTGVEASFRACTGDHREVWVGHGCGTPTHHHHG